MSINFEHPWLLLLLIPLAAAALIPFFIARKKRRQARRHLLSLVLRLVSLLLAVLTVSGFTAGRTTDKNAVIIVADLSDSTRNIEEDMKQAVKIAASYANNKTEVGLLTFGYNSFYELPLSPEPDFSNFETEPSGNYTDIYSALIKAAAMMPNGYSKRIVLLTDGKENVGRVSEAANVLLTRGIRLDAIVYETGVTDKEVQITDLSTPDSVYQGENFNITVTVESSCECSGTLSLYCDTALAVRQDVKLTAGTNRFVFRDTAVLTGISTYSAELTSDSDSLGKNNKVYTFIKIFGQPKLLIVDGTGNESHEFVKIIGDSADVKVVNPSNVPADIAELRQYNAVILMNVAKKRLPDNWDSLLEVYVRQLGRGLFTTGGNQSYALGGWTDSVLEKVLPVNMRITDKVAICDMSIVLVIDHSGSMGRGNGSPLELAKQGAILAAGAVKDIDEVGVIAFSDNASWVAKLTPGTEKTSVQNKIASIGEGGGTMIYTALYTAAKALEESNKSVKNILLLTDGDPADSDALFASGLLQEMVDNNIVVSSIAVGTSINENILKNISEPTGGSITYCTNVNTLPDVIFEETTKLLENNYINNVTFTPSVVDYTQVLSGISGMPELDGYIMTEIKDLAYNVLGTDDSDPVLATWQYGLGKTASLTTDLNGKWSSKLLASENGRALLKNIISYVLPTDEDSETGTLTLTRKGDKGIITAISPDKDNTYKTKATIISPSGAEKEIELVQSGLGEYSGEFLLEEEGGYVAIVSQQNDDGNAVMYKESALAVKYSDEYDMFIKDTGAVAAACIRTGGKGDWKDIKDILSTKLTLERESLQFTNLFLTLIIILTMADIALRRLDISLIFPKKEKKAKVPAAAEATATVEKTVKTAAYKEAKTSGQQKYTESDRAENVGNKLKSQKKTDKVPPEPPKAEGKSSTVSSLLQQKNNQNKKL